MAKDSTIVGTVSRKSIGATNSLRNHLRSSLFRNAYYLMANSVILSMSGLLFWTIAARTFVVEEVGLASAILSAIGILCMISTIGLGHGLIRFIHQSGQESGNLINSSLSVVSLTSIILGAVYLFGIPIWSPALAALRENVFYAALFVVIVMFWTLFNILDSVFIAFRASKLTLTKNAFVSVLKVTVIFLMMAGTGAIGIVVASGFAVMVGTVISLILFLPKLIRRFFPRPSVDFGMISGLMRYSLANYVSSIFLTAPSLLFPLLVINILGPESTAYFYIAWSIAAIVSVIPGSLSSSLFAEGSYDSEDLYKNTRKSLRTVVLLLAPVIFSIFIFGGKFLLLFGAEYSEEGTELLWLLSISAFPLSVVYFFLTYLRVEKNMHCLLVFSGSLGSLTIGICTVMCIQIGLIGVGVGWLCAQCIAALIAFAMGRRGVKWI